MKSNKAEENLKYIIKQPNNVSWEKCQYLIVTIDFWSALFLREIALNITNERVLHLLFFEGLYLRKGQIIFLKLELKPNTAVAKRG